MNSTSLVRRAARTEEEIAVVGGRIYRWCQLERCRVRQSPQLVERHVMLTFGLQYISTTSESIRVHRMTHENVEYSDTGENRKPYPNYISPCLWVRTSRFRDVATHNALQTIS